MKKNKNSLSVLILALFTLHFINAQIPAEIKSIFPEGTIMNSDIPYAQDTLKKHLLDIYLPHNAKGKIPLVIWIHGGAWRMNDKFADMDYMKSTIKSLIENNYAIASIDYRFSTTAVFPAQLQDCNAAIDFLYKNADKYNIDKDRFAVMGFSAGGHLASMVGLSNNENIRNFRMKDEALNFKIKAVVDFYGPTEMLVGSMMLKDLDTFAIKKLLGARALERPDLAEIASPTSYVDKDDPPFLIVHGEKDELVPVSQSYILQSYLKLNNVKNELIIVKGAPHFGVMFDSEKIRSKVLQFLKLNL